MICNTYRQIVDSCLEWCANRSRLLLFIFYVVAVPHYVNFVMRWGTALKGASRRRTTPKRGSSLSGHWMGHLFYSLSGGHDGASVGNSHRSAGPRPTTLKEDRELFVDFSSILCLWFEIQDMRTYNFFDWISNTGWRLVDGNPSGLTVRRPLSVR